MTARRAMPGPPSLLRPGLLATAVVGAVALPLAAVLAGPDGLLGAALGLALTAAFFTVSALVVTAAGRHSPRAMLPAALATYVGKLWLLGLSLFLVRDQQAFDTAAFAWTLMAATLGWVTAQARSVWRTPQPYVVPAPAARTKPD